MKDCATFFFNFVIFFTFRRVCTRFLHNLKHFPSSSTTFCCAVQKFLSDFRFFFHKKRPCDHALLCTSPKSFLAFINMRFAVSYSSPISSMMCLRSAAYVSLLSVCSILHASCSAVSGEIPRNSSHFLRMR